MKLLRKVSSDVENITVQNICSFVYFLKSVYGDMYKHTHISFIMHFYRTHKNYFQELLFRSQTGGAKIFYIFQSMS